ncbi:MAG: glycosyltransferase [Candidatus Eremiobacterota bacterium]
MINVSVVVYKEDYKQLEKLVAVLCGEKLVNKVYVIDNSPGDYLKDIKSLSPKIEYIFTGDNLGYGRAHNIAIKKSIVSSIPYHIVINPDISLANGVIEKLFFFMESNLNVSLIMPKILFPDGRTQFLCRLLPTPLDLILRRFLPFSRMLEKRNYNYELRFTGYNRLMSPPVMSGCFMFLRVNDLKEIGVFDERYFMYLEDIDLIRRIRSKKQIIFYPEVSVYHEHNRGSYRNFRLLFQHIRSAFIYFNKWGWFFDSERKRINSLFLSEFGKN